MTELRDLLYRIRELHAIKPSRSSALAAARNQAVGGDIAGATAAVDAVELEMLPAVAAGGGGGGGFGDYALYSGAEVSMPSAATTPIPLTVVSDDPGWLQTDDAYDSTNWMGQTVPATAWFALPAGVYWIEGSATWNPGSNGERAFFVCPIADEFATSPDVPLWYSSGPSPTQASMKFPTTALSVSGSLFQQPFSTVQVVLDSVAPLPFGVFAKHTVGNEYAMPGCFVGVMQIA